MIKTDSQPAMREKNEGVENCGVKQNHYQSLYQVKHNVEHT